MKTKLEDDVVGVVLLLMVWGLVSQRLNLQRGREEFSVVTIFYCNVCTTTLHNPSDRLVNGSGPSAIVIRMHKKYTGKTEGKAREVGLYTFPYTLRSK